MNRRVWLLAAGAVALRALASLATLVVAPDGSRYLMMAREMLNGDFYGALSTPPFAHPLYPLLIAFLQVIFGSGLFAGIALSSVLGGLAVVPLYLLSRDAWGERVATLAGLLFIFLPEHVILSADVMTEPLFFLLFVLAMATGWSSLEKGSWERAVLAGGLTGAAWLTRPEGVYLVPLYIFACAWHPRRFAFAGAGLFLATALVVATPYLGFIKGQTGKVGLSASPYSAGVIGLLTGETRPVGYQVTEEGAREFGEYRYIQDYGKFLGPTLYILKTSSKVLFHVLWPFLLIGFWYLKRRTTRWGPACFLLIAAGGYFIPPVLAFVAGTPFGYRYILPTFVLLLPVAAIGFLEAGRWMRHPKALPILLGVIFLVMAGKALKPRRAEKVGIKLSGIALHEARGPGQRVLGTAQEVAYYADGSFIPLPPGATFEDLEKLVAEEKIDAIAFYLRDLRNYGEGLQQKVEAKYRMLGEYPSPLGKGQRPVRVYLVTRDP